MVKQSAMTGTESREDKSGRPKIGRLESTSPRERQTPLVATRPVDRQQADQPGARKTQPAQVEGSAAIAEVTSAGRHSPRLAARAKSSPARCRREAGGCCEAEGGGAAHCSA